MVASNRWRNLGAAAGAATAALFAIFDLYQWALAYAGDRFHNDFTFYFAAARIGLAHGWGSIYDLALQQAQLDAMGSRITIAELARYISPPPVAWLALPFTVLPYGVAYWAWSALLVGALVSGSAGRGPDTPRLAGRRGGMAAHHLRPSARPARTPGRPWCGRLVCPSQSGPAIPRRARAWRPRPQATARLPRPARTPGDAALPRLRGQRRGARGAGRRVAARARTRRRPRLPRSPELRLQRSGQPRADARLRAGRRGPAGADLRRRLDRAHGQPTARARPGMGLRLGADRRHAGHAVRAPRRPRDARACRVAVVSHRPAHLGVDLRPGRGAGHRGRADLGAAAGPRRRAGGAGPGFSRGAYVRAGAAGVGAGA